MGFGPYEDLRTNEDFISVMGALEANEEEEAKTEKGKPKKEKAEKKEVDVKSIKKEEHLIGFAPLSMYCKYMSSSFDSCWPIFGIVFLYIFVQCVYLFVPFWMTRWAE